MFNLVLSWVPNHDLSMLVAIDHGVLLLASNELYRAFVAATVFGV